MKILVVDDEPAVLRTELRALEAVGYTCRGASTIDDANGFLTSEHFDLAVLDVNLGNGNGLTLAKTIQDDHPDTSVIMVTGVADFTSVSDARLAGALDYLVKPVGPTALTDAVKRVSEIRLRRNSGAGPRRVRPHQTDVTPLHPRTTPLPEAGVGEPAIDRFFHQMVALGASDLHLSSGAAPNIRKDGQMRPLDPAAPALTAEEVVELLDPIVPGKNRLEFGRRHDSDFAYEIPGLGRFRCNIFLDRRGMGAVFRRVPTHIATAEEMGLSSGILALCELKKGLVLVTGPTGSGKSTTLAAMIDYVNRHRTDHIVTVEDPIEFVHENKRCVINQREVHSHTKSFKTALRAALREDPDVILIGEMRDLETVQIALETAETGHLVFGTLHTTTAPSTIDRIIDQFPAHGQAQIRVMLAETLKGVIAQTLCRRINGGRVAALEVMTVTSAIANLIREGKTHQIPAMMQVGKGAGMITLNDALDTLVSRGFVSKEEAALHRIEKEHPR
jgi:twitching motility protein PilT